VPTQPIVRIGARGSRLSRAQAGQMQRRIAAALGAGPEDAERVAPLVIISTTGLSYIDLKYLSKEHILKDNEDSFFIRKPRQKTGQDSVIPLLPAVKRILQKYSKTDDIRDFQWQVLSNQKMNQRLKRIATLARVSKSLHMHLARHSFATTVTLCNGVPLESVSQMMGHSSLRQTQHYAKIVPLKLKTDMDKISELFK